VKKTAEKSFFGKKATLFDGKRACWFFATLAQKAAAGPLPALPKVLARFFWIILTN